MNSSDLQTISLPVLGMTCAGCASSVQSILDAQEGIDKAEVNYATQQVRISFHKNIIQPVQFQQTLQGAGYDLILDTENADHAQQEARNVQYASLKKRTLFSAALTLPVVMIGMFLMNMPYANYIMLFLTTPVLFVFGSHFFVNAYKQARHSRANMDSLVALSTGISYLFSVFNTFFSEFWHRRGIHPHVYYEAAAVIIVFILLGKLLEENAKSNTSSAIRKLMGLQPKTVFLVREEGIQEIDISAVLKGDLLLVRPGDKIPVDGQLQDGNSYVDESMITGEPVAVFKQENDKVYAGTINRSGSFRFYATRIGSETLLAQIIKRVQDAQGSKAPVQKVADKIAAVFVPIVLLIAVLTLAVWLLVGGEHRLSQGLMAMVTVLVIACPCALGLATPTAIMVGMGIGAENGILIKDAEALETGYKVDTIVLDKTGTLTKGTPEVTDIAWLDAYEADQDKHLEALLGMELVSAHPLAAAIVIYLKSLKVNAAGIRDFRHLNGIGVEAVVDNEQYFAGSRKILEMRSLSISKKLTKRIQSLGATANTLIYFGNSVGILAVVAIKDELKQGSAHAIQQLKHSGMAVHMLTGDNVGTATAIARASGIETFSAEVLPSEKATYIRMLQQQGKIVAMVGDGINDSEALAQADLSIAMGQGSDIAMETAKVTLISSDLRQIPKALKLSAATVKTIRQNLFWAFIYNLIGIPLAAGILYPVNGFLLNPMIAGAAMALSSVSVVTNSLKLKFIKL